MRADSLRALLAHAIDYAGLFPPANLALEPALKNYHLLPAVRGDLRENAERLLAEGSDAIDRALSQDSMAFLAANRQEGGQ